MRLSLAMLIALCGCDKLFDLSPVPDAARDSPVFDASLYQIGCADGTREGFTDLDRAKEIAGCAGAWTIAGIKPEPAAACNRLAGNTGENLLGTGCSASDLCAPLWYICTDRLEVLERVPDQMCGTSWPSLTFFATAQSGPGGGLCDATGKNDVFGCGSLGEPAQPSCAPLDRVSGNDCSAISAVGGWACLSPEEPTNITKSDPLVGGGVLCCRAEVPL